MRCCVSMVEVLSSGNLAITVDPAGGLLRVLDAPPEEGDNYPPYSAICTYDKLSATEIVLRGFVGSGVQRGHLRLILEWARAHGFEWLYAERLPSRRIPGAVRRSARPLAGWYEVNLLAL